MEENILCAICSENIRYSEGTLWFERADGSEVLICDCCCDMLDDAEGNDEDARIRAAEYFRRQIDIYTDDDVAEQLSKLFSQE